MLRTPFDLSGFAGIVNLDGAPATDADVRHLATPLARHGNQGTRTRVMGHAAFACTALDSLPEAARERQPCSFDPDTWIIGDVRVDARADLVGRLQDAGRPASADQPDIELVLHAFQSWGKDCLRHLLGDYAFVVWERARHTVWCARDPFGVKPLYFVLHGNRFLFANDIPALRAHPMVSSALYEPAIADFLAFGLNLDEHRTFFRDIQRLPPAHTLRVGQQGVPTSRRHWQPGTAQEHRYRRAGEYTEHFQELLWAAVGDRLRSDHIAFELSGGLDSTSVAALACTLGAAAGPFSTFAYTTDNPREPAGAREAEFAALVAGQCDIEHHLIEAGRADELWCDFGTHQPYNWPFVATNRRAACAVRNRARVMLTGQGGDPLVSGSGYEMLDTWRTGGLPALLGFVRRSGLARRSLRGLGWRALWNRDLPRIRLPAMPPWLDPSFTERNGCIDRWLELYYRPRRYPRGCRSELAHDELAMPAWSHLFEDYYHDLFCGIDCRHPLFDLRLVEFLLAVPAHLKGGKRLMREAMRGLLPEPVRTRTKSVVLETVVQTALAREGVLAALDLRLAHCPAPLDRLAYRDALDRFVRSGEGDIFTLICPLGLDLWLSRNHLAC